MRFIINIKLDVNFIFIFMKKLIGYIYQSPIMSIRRHLYQDNNNFYTDLENLKINNFPSEFLNLSYPVHINLSNAKTHDEYIQDTKRIDFLDYFYIRNDTIKKCYKIKNNNYIKYNI